MSVPPPINLSAVNGQQVSSSAPTPILNYNELFSQYKKNEDEKRMKEKESLVHRACDENRIRYIHDGKRFNHGVLEYLTWVPADNEIGERVSNDHLEKMCRSYASRTVAGGNRGGKRKTRKVRRSRK
jgi:hypothetical protein